MTEAAGNFTREKTRLAGCYVLRTKVREDMRGSFTKVYHEGAFREFVEKIIIMSGNELPIDDERTI